MKYYIIIFTGILLFSISCKTKKPSSQPTKENSQTIDESVIKPKTLGTISHQYRVTGCNTVIFVKKEGNENQLVLIPKDSLPKDFDKEGKEIYFDYRLLRIKNPPGCSKGIPAELSNISKK